MLERIAATRYVTPLREGGSLPGVVEADDLGTYVVKFREAGQGRRVLVAEIIAAELGRRLGFKVPDLKLVDLDPQLGIREPDEEVQDLLKASTGLNLAVDFLPGALGFEPLAWVADPVFAARVVWFDGLIHNIDRSWRNPNLLIWHRDTWLIDHGAALWFHHNWRTADPRRAFDAGDHVLAPYAGDVDAAGAELAAKIDRELLETVTALVPDEWLAGEPGFDGPAAVREAYVEHLLRRADGPHDWLVRTGEKAPRQGQGPGSVGEFWRGGGR
ncbi:aminotransferase class I and II [Nonomuraea phyllanthi]|uniref:Aminotransferase class I and II n=1 Tax=Nonomuraea phyllanthi TaxID=2219224 RepID=A0A5C4V7K4_9ACTN|nr:HipA family kinase [Nonomuraea phyllanthi]KAB8187569.1 aminotransferase class I and II [Nonomuraea phyllanthi]QFY06999.1 aminotransferase class I and II [Nonomuraea phyllanthi]